MTRRSPPPELAAHWERFQQDRCPKSREWLILHYGYLVPKSRERIVPVIPWRIEEEDLLAEGTLALIKALDRFEPARGVQFVSMAITWIRGAMLECLRHGDYTPRSVRQRHNEFREAVDHLWVMGEPFSSPACARVLGLTADEFAAFRQAAEPMVVVSLEEIKHEDPEGCEPVRYQAVLGDEQPGPEALALEQQKSAALGTALSRLSAPERYVLTRYYWQDETLKTIAGQLGRSESRTHQLRSAAIKHLRARPEFAGVEG